MSKVTVFAEQFIKPECVENALPLFKEMVEKTRMESGNITYTLYEDKDNKTHFMYFEEWENQEALDMHIKTPHFMTIIPQIREMSEKTGTFVNGFPVF